MQIVKTEIIKVSSKEYEALTEVQDMMEMLLRESDNPDIKNYADAVLQGIFDLGDYFEEVE